VKLRIFCKDMAIIAMPLTVAAGLFLLTGCATRPGPVRQLSNPLIEAECPELCPLGADGKPSCSAPDTFGDTVLLVEELAGRYHRCRAAALAGQPPAP
jgi:hypothetical protein